MSDEILDKPPAEKEGDDTVNTPDDVEKVTHPDDMEEVDDHDDDDDDDDDDA